MAIDRRGGARLVCAAVCAIVSGAGCGGPSEARRGPPPGTTHARAAPAEGAQPAALRRALADAASPEEVIRVADRLEASGETLDGGERGRVMRAADRASAWELESLWSQLVGEGAAAAAIALRAAKWALHRGDDAEALAWLRRVGGDAELEDAGAALKAEILDLREVAPGRVAVLLPLSGRHAAVGEEIRRAVDIAAADADDAEVVFVDTGGEPRGAAAAVDEAVRRHRAAVLLGPVGRLESAAASRRAVALGVPIALLSPAVAGGSPGAGVVRLWSSPAREGRQAARLAARLRYERAGILAPRDDGGAARARAFADEAARLGIEIAARGDYDPTATELEPDLRAFLGLDPANNERLRRHLRRRGRDGWKTFVPDLDVELLYIPDRYDRAALVASFLPYFNVEVRTDPFMDVRALRDKYGEVPPVVQLVGSAGWLHPSLIPRGGRAVRGALIVGVCRDLELAGDDGRALVAAWEARHGRKPGDVAAQAFDAASLVFDARRYAAAQRRPDLRREIGRALSRMVIDDGACGPARVAGGELAREPAIFEVEADEIVPFDE